MIPRPLGRGSSFVLFGDMSIVGPRPHAISEVEKYRTQVTGSMHRHMIKPGLAQIYGTRGEVDLKDKMLIVLTQKCLHNSVNYYMLPTRTRENRILGG